MYRTSLACYVSSSVSQDCEDLTDRSNSRLDVLNYDMPVLERVALSGTESQRLVVRKPLLGRHLEDAMKHFNDALHVLDGDLLVLRMLVFRSDSQDHSLNAMLVVD